MKNFGLFLGLLLLLCLAADCKSDAGTSAENSTENEERPAPAPIPRFDRDSAYAFVARQVAFGPRVPGTDAHQAAKEWLAAKLEAYGAEVIQQDFQARLYDGRTLPATNIIGQINPGAERRLLLAAHWDTRASADYDPDETRRDEPILGADDGASGVGVLLEIARMLHENPLDLGVDIVFFDAEDQGFDADTPEESQPDSWGLGAQYWSRNLHRSGYNPMYGILLDMVGAKNARFPKEGFSMKYARRQVEKVWKLARNMGYGAYFVNETAGGVTDDHYFVNTIARIPMIDIIHKKKNSPTGFGAHWHTHDDNMDVINKGTLRAVGQVVLAVIYKEAAGVI